MNPGPQIGCVQYSPDRRPDVRPALLLHLVRQPGGAGHHREQPGARVLPAPAGQCRVPHVSQHLLRVARVQEADVLRAAVRHHGLVHPLLTEPVHLGPDHAPLLPPVLQSQLPL